MSDLDPYPDAPELNPGYGCAAWAIWYAASGFIAIAFFGLILGALDTNGLVIGVGLVALIPAVLVGRAGVRRLRAMFAAEQRVDEWNARQPGGRERLRARYRRAVITAGIGLTAIVLYHLAVSPLLGVMVLVGLGLVLLPFAPYIRRQVRRYRELMGITGASRGRRRRRRS
jgi:hypothetical protein